MSERPKRPNSPCISEPTSAEHTGNCCSRKPGERGSERTHPASLYPRARSTMASVAPESIVSERAKRASSPYISAPTSEEHIGDCWPKRRGERAREASELTLHVGTARRKAYRKVLRASSPCTIAQRASIKLASVARDSQVSERTKRASSSCTSAPRSDDPTDKCGSLQQGKRASDASELTLHLCTQKQGSQKRAHPASLHAEARTVKCDSQKRGRRAREASELTLHLCTQTQGAHWQVLLSTAGWANERSEQNHPASMHTKAGRTLASVAPDSEVSERAKRASSPCIAPHGGEEDTGKYCPVQRGARASEASELTLHLCTQRRRAHCRVLLATARCAKEQHERIHLVSLDKKQRSSWQPLLPTAR